MRMQLISCKITNFKSIQDTGFFNFPIDNITAIIGQNESGKTSILEALEIFSTGKLNPDALRDDSYPEITCVFRVQKAWFDENFEDGELPRGLKAKIKEADNKISLTRTWTAPTKNNVSINFLDIDTLFAPPAPPELPKSPEPTANGETVEASTPSLVPETTPAPSPEPQVSPLDAKGFMDRVIASLPEFQKFIDFESLLPDKMDVADITNKKPKAKGLHGVLNLLEIMGISVDQLEQLGDRQRNNQLTRKNTTFTADFRQFWSQKIGKRDEIEIQVTFHRHGKEETERIGESYLSFWVVENGTQFSPEQRSKGLQWFLSFYLQLKANSVRSEEKRDLILLIDEPAGSLHAKAQEDVLRVFETLKKNVQVIYTTHTHHLLDLTKLYRIIAAQREISADEYSLSELANTMVFSAHELGALSSDTLTPIFDCMGSSFANQNVIDRTNNIIVEEVSVCYYLQAFFKLKGIKNVHLLPANGTTTVPQLARLLFGWGITYGILVDDEDSGKKSIEKVRKEVYPGNNLKDRLDKIFRVIPGCKGIEDVFSKDNFAKLIAEVDPKDISKENSVYMKQPKKKESKGLLAVRFFNAVEDEKITLNELDNNTKKNMDKLMKVVAEIIGEISPPTQTDAIVEPTVSQ